MRRSALLVTLIALTGIACKKAPPAPQTAEQPMVSPVATPVQSAPAVDPAADPWTKSQQPPARDPLKKPMFWSATKAGKTTYFLGTMHLGVDAESRLPQVVFDKLDAAPVFAMETDATDRAIIGMGQRTSGTLHEELGPVYWKKLEGLIEPAVLRGLDQLKPAIAAAMLSMRGLPQTPPMDGILLARSQRQKKQLVYLEPAIKQAQLLEKWMDLRALKMMLDAPDKGLESTKRMLEAYVSGDDAKLLALSDEQKPDQLKAGYTEAEYKQSMEEMLFERNASWIPAIEKLHATGNGFVAVGALHLVGKRSVLDLLATRGFKIARITP